MEAISPERVREAYAKAPQMVRDVFGSEETVAIIMDIRSRYNLHVDVAGELGKNVGYMLLGLLSPAEFLGQMVLAGVDQNDARGVLEALNTKIFIPLQKNMKNGTTAAAPVTSEPTSYMEPTAAVQPVSTHAQVLPKTAPVVPPPTLIEKAPLPIVNTPAPVASAPIPERIPSYNLIRPDALTTVSTKEPVAEMRTMQSDMQAIQHPEDRLAHYAQMPAGHIPSTAHLTPAQVFQTASVPVPASRPLFTVGDVTRAPIQAPIIKPIVLPAPQAPVAVPVSAIPIPTASTENRSGDPYREPV